MDLKVLSKKLVGNDEERAVSPVIGIILMVAITVILAAVIAAFVLDLGDSVDSEAQAGVAVDGDGTENVTVSVNSMSNAESVYIANSSGEMVKNPEAGPTGETNSTGATWQFNSTKHGNETLSVVATLGGEGEDAETTTTIQTFEVAGQD